MGFSRYFKFLMDVDGYSRSLADVSGYLVSVESSGFLRCGVDIGGNFRLGGFFKFWFGVRVIYYRAFLLAMGGGK